MTRLPFRLERNFRFSLVRWVFSMTKMTSAHSTCSDDNGTLAPLEMPAESISIPGQVEKICSAVGLRRRLALQTNKTLVMIYRGGCWRATDSASPEADATGTSRRETLSRQRVGPRLHSCIQAF